MVIQTSCRHCELDIENSAPFRRGQWQDRGGNTRCNDGKHAHGPMAGEIARHRAEAQADPAMTRLWLYRVLENDDEGDPLDHGPVFAIDLARAKTLVKAHLLTLGTFGWDSGTLRVRFYNLGPARLTEGVVTSDEPFTDVTLRATKTEVEANPS